MNFTIKENERKNTWFSSDNHFFHQNVIKYCGRPFTTVEEMNEKMITLWNETINPEDTVYYLGDFSMAFRSVELFTKRLNGKKILFSGNHDHCHPAHKKARTLEKQKEWEQKYIDNGWTEVHMTGTINIEGVGIFNVNHLPYLESDAQQDQRHAKFRTSNDGRWLLCGHVHQHWAQREKMINVGVDVRNFKPISAEEIAAIVNASPDGYPKQNVVIQNDNY